MEKRDRRRGEIKWRRKRMERKERKNGEETEGRVEIKWRSERM